jgi:hypothetical protein
MLKKPLPVDTALATMRESATLEVGKTRAGGRRGL